MTAAVMAAVAPWGRLSRRLRAAWRTAPRPPTRAEEAEQLREFARSVQRHDRGFADDLFAAAARHEGGE